MRFYNIYNNKLSILDEKSVVFAANELSEFFRSRLIYVKQDFCVFFPPGKNCTTFASHHHYHSFFCARLRASSSGISQINIRPERVPNCILMARIFDTRSPIKTDKQAICPVRLHDSPGVPEVPEVPESSPIAPHTI